MSVILSRTSTSSGLLNSYFLDSILRPSRQPYNRGCSCTNGLETTWPLRYFMIVIAPAFDILLIWCLVMSKAYQFVEWTMIAKQLPESNRCITVWIKALLWDEIITFPVCYMPMSAHRNAFRIGEASCLRQDLGSRLVLVCGHALPECLGSAWSLAGDLAIARDSPRRQLILGIHPADSEPVDELYMASQIWLHIYGKPGVMWTKEWIIRSAILAASWSSRLALMSGLEL